MEQTISLFLIRLFFLGFLSLPVFAQLPRVQNEKIYLLPDKNAVQPGDTLLVSGLVLESYDFSGPYSRYVHVELLDTRDSVVSRQKLNCTSAGLFGTRLAVDSFQTPGMYYVRAYTRLMRNFPAWTLPIRPVRIGMAPADPVRAAVNEIYKVRFYPEGGRMVAECPQQVVYEVSDPNGNPLVVKGDLLDERNSVIRSGLATFPDGKGTIRFMPRRGTSYTLRLKNPDGRGTLCYELPAADTIPSIQMSINRGRLRYSLTSASKAEKAYRFVLFFRGNRLLEDTLSVRRPSGIVDISAYPSGMYAGVLLHAPDSMLAERLIADWPALSDGAPDLQTDRAVYTPGALARIDCVPADAVARYLYRVEKIGENSPLVAALPETGRAEQLPVFSEPTPEPIAETILTYLNLSSELEWPLAGRHGLFTDEGQPDEAAVDRLLIASRWKRYKWTDVLQSRLALPFQPETLLALSGRVESELGNRLKKGGEMVALDNITGFAYTGEITSDSRFRVGVDDFPEGHSFFMQAYDSKGKSYSLKIIPDNDTYPVVDNRLKYRLERKERGNAVLETNVGGEITFSYDKHNRKNYHLPEIEVAARIHQKEVALNRIYEPFKLTEEQIDQFAYPDIIPLLDRMVGFQVRKVSLDPSDNSDDPLHFRYGIFSTRGASSLRGSDDLHDYQIGEMPVILDGVLTDTHQVIMNYPPKVIHSIERLTPAKALAYTSHAFDGALLITTRGWKAAGFKSKGIRYKPPGLSPWAVPPPVLPCSLRVPAEEGVYRIVAEGVDGEGNPRRLTCEIRVKR